MPATARPPQATAAVPAAGTKYRFQVKFYRRMRLNHVYPVVVSAKSLGGGIGAGTPVLLRAVVPGALVTPAELSLDAADPKAAATFYVTPLARGWLPDARIEVHSHGNVLQTLRLSMKATSQRLTWFLAFLTLAIPAFLLHATVYHKMEGNVPRTSSIPAGLGGAEPIDGPAPKEPKKDEPPPANPAPGQPPTTRGPAEGALLRGLIALIDLGGAGDVQKDTKDPKKEEKPAPDKAADEKKEPEAKEKPEAKPEVKKEGEPAPGPQKKAAPQRKKADRPPGAVPKGGGGGGFMEAALQEAPRRAQTTRTVEFPGTPGELLERQIREHIPDVPESWREQYTWLPPLTRNAASYLGQLYDLACALAQDKLSFWVGIVFLALTLWSCMTHRSVRGRRSGAPIVLSP
jgi:hypothetical protein